MYNINTGRSYFAIVNVLGKTYACPGWHEVPLGTTRDEINLIFTGNSFKAKASLEPKNEVSNFEWKVEGSKGSIYKVTKISDRWDCTCPARNFRRGDCKHITNQKTLVKVK